MKTWLAILCLCAAACGGESAFVFSFNGRWQGDLELTEDSCGVAVGGLSETHDVIQGESSITLQIGDSIYSGGADSLSFSAFSSFPACCVDSAGHEFGKTTRHETYDYRRVSESTAEVAFVQEFQGGCHPGCRRVWQGMFRRQ